jgi:hypothetical protein
MQRLLTILAVLWASPWTLLGLAIGALGLLTGGKVQRAGRVIEFCGGAVRLGLRWLPFVRGASALTLGHTVLGQTVSDLDACRTHELVHVRQYERWGPLFVPAYLLFWWLLWLQGKSPYFDNPFEREAFEKEGGG